MTTALGALLIGVAGAALLLALVAFLWVNRTPSTNERFDEYGRVPLFGVDLSAPPSAAETLASPTAGTIPELETATDRPWSSGVTAAPSPANGRVTALAFSPRPMSVRPVGEPVAIDTSALEPSNGTANAGLPPAPPGEIHRPGGGGWGPRRGWPLAAEQAVTPRFVAPVQEGPKAAPSSFTHAEPPPNGNGVIADGVPGSMVEGHRLRFSTPMEGTLQFLPGRLEISSGLDVGREIRFVRVPGPNGMQVTFGRNEGPLYRHIQLRDQTVSREHARMTLVEGRWLLTNLSNTNPVAHNGRVLSPGEHQSLEDGDRVEMGEVVFSFRSR